MHGSVRLIGVFEFLSQFFDLFGSAAFNIFLFAFGLREFKAKSVQLLFRIERRNPFLRHNKVNRYSPIEKDSHRRHT